jgi:hypothetical protein
MTYKDPEKQRNYCRDWARRKAIENRGGLPSPRSVNFKFLTPEERESRKRETNKRCRENYKKKLKRKLDELIGSSCYICHSERSLVAHEVYGIPHNGNGADQFVDAFDRPKDFVRLCYSCHKGVHWVMRWFNMSWKEIISKIRAPIVQ